MTEKLTNWTYQNVADFLQERGFDYQEGVSGTERAWISYHYNGEPDRIVEIKNTWAFYTPKALRKMIKQSGIPEQQWIEWATKR